MNINPDSTRVLHGLYFHWMVLLFTLTDAGCQAMMESPVFTKPVPVENKVISAN